MVDDLTGFSGNHVVIFKLGQIESCLKSIEETLQMDRANFHDRLEKTETTVEGLKNDRARMFGGFAVLGVIAVFIKDFAFKWLNLH